MKRRVVAGILVTVVLTGILALVYVPFLISSKIECVKPPNGFLVIESGRGYNDSADKGVPQNHWPKINVLEGQSVNMVVCNIDIQAHALQIQHYYETIQIEMPNQVVRISFAANQAGTFQIYSGIFDTLQAVEQSGELTVSA